MSVVFPVEHSDRYERYTLTAGQTVVAVPFPFQDNADLEINRVTLAGVTTSLAEPVDYELIGAGVPTGGYLTLEVAAAAGDQLEIIGRTVLERLTSIARAGKFSSKALDDDFDRSMIALQELRRDADRAVKLPFGNDGITLFAGAPNTVAVFRADGNIEGRASGTVDTELFVPTPFMRAGFEAWGNGDAALSGIGGGAAGISLFKMATVAAVIAFTGTGTGLFSSTEGANIHRMNDRVFIGDGALFGGQVGDPATFTGVDPLTKKLHVWGLRDARVLIIDSAGSFALVTHTQSSKGVNYWAYPGVQGGAIASANFAINDMPGFIPVWAGYDDVTRMALAGFTVGREISLANYGTEPNPTPFNQWTGGADAGVGLWQQTGGGQDVNSFDYVTVKHGAAHRVTISSFRPGHLGGGKTAWAYDTTYPKGHVAAQGYGGTNYVILVPHTTPSNGTFAAFRAANPTYYALQQRVNYLAGLSIKAGDMVRDNQNTAWYYAQVDCVLAGARFSQHRNANPTHFRALPAAMADRIVTPGSLVENSPGSQLFFADKLPERHLISWWRPTAAGGTELAAFIIAEESTEGAPTVVISMKENLIDFSASDGLRADALRLGGQTNYALFSRGVNANDDMVANNPGTGKFTFQVAAADIAYISSSGISVTGLKSYFVGSNRVLSARKTGWTRATGTATRTTFDTATVTLPQLAERFKAMLDDFHNVTGHGALGD